MPDQSINFFSEDISFNLKDKTVLRNWLIKAAHNEKHKVSELNYVFCSDAYLKKINKQFLNHNYFTDIITFPSSEPGDKNISGDIFISIDRVKENAGIYEVNFKDELHRVMIHGLLHLCGYGDKSEAEIKKMRAKEDFYLKKR